MDLAIYFSVEGKIVLLELKRAMEKSLYVLKKLFKNPLSLSHQYSGDVFELVVMVSRRDIITVTVT